MMSQRKYDVLVLLTIAVCVFLRFFKLTSQSLWFDEGWSLHYSEGPTLLDAVAKLTDTNTSERYQPLYFITLYLSRRVFGDSEFALRALSVIFGIGAAIFLYLAALLLFGRKRALWSLILFSLSSYAVYYSQEVRPYALLLLISSIQLLFFAKVLCGKKPPDDPIWKWLLGIVTGIGILGSVFMLLFSLALCLSHLLVYKQPTRWLRTWIPAGISSLPAILFYIHSPSSNGVANAGVAGLTQPIVENLIFVPYGILVGHSFGPPMQSLRGDDRVQVVLSYWPELLLLFFLVALICVFIALSLRKRAETHWHYKVDCLLISVLVMSFLLSVMFAVITRFNWQPRHSFFLCFPIALLIPLILHETNSSGKAIQRLFRYRQAPLILFLVLNAYSIFNYYFDRNYHRDDYRSAAKYLAANASVPSVLLWGMPDLLRYYGDAHTIDGRSLRRSNLSEEISDITNDSDTVFVAVNREFYWGKKNSVKSSMDNLYVCLHKRSFAYFSVYAFVRRR